MSNATNLASNSRDDFWRDRHLFKHKSVLWLVSKVCSDFAIKLSDRDAQAAEILTNRINSVSQRVVNKSKRPT